MSRILRNAPVRQLATLLSLFPIKALREAWALKGHKGDLATAIATDRNVKKISAFIHTGINLCKQHVYLFKTNLPLDEFVKFEFGELDPLELPDGADLSRRNFLDTIRYEVAIWTDPPERRYFEYVLPIRIEFLNGYLLVRFAKFERKLVNEDIDLDNATIKHHRHEPEIIADISRTLIRGGYNVRPLDLHKGVKHLWATDVIDGFNVACKLPGSERTVKMDLKAGIKTTDPDEYERLKDATYARSVFKTIVEDDKMSLDFTVNMTTGFISFSKYTEAPEEADAIIGQILKFNR